MKIYQRFFVVLACFFMLFLSFAQDDALAACSPLPSVNIVGDNTYTPADPTSIQEAYDYASSDLGLSSFTLQLANEIFTEDLILDGGAVVLDGGYDCSFTTRISPSSILGTITISTGSLNVATGTEGPRVVTTPQCDFDRDGDGFTSIGSCEGSADDCDDNNPDIYPGAFEICDGSDNNCDGQIDEGATPTDVDGDGYYAIGSCGAVADDCNDNDPNIHPGALDIPYDGVDQDCKDGDLRYIPEQNTCSSIPCHGSANNWASWHDMTTAPDGTCATCHAAQVGNVLPGHYGKPLRTDGNNMTVPSTIVCTSCHDMDSDNHNEELTLGNGSNFVTNKTYATWPSITCDNCHDNRASLHATDTAHDNRIIDTLCDGCHTSDTSALGSPGNGTLANDSDVDTLHRSDCALCHNYTGAALDAGIVRQAIQQGLDGTQISCLDCHTDKGINHGDHEHPIEVGPNDLSYGAPGTLCGACHVVANWAEIEGVEHNVPTNGVGSCATCHNSPRQVVRDAIDLAANPTNCLVCHADKELTPHGSVDHVAFGYVTGGTTSCITCHDPGIAENATVTVIHANDCFLCHAGGLELQPGLPPGGGDCTACHTDAWEDTHSVNTPDHNTLVQVASTGCADCHDNPPPLTDAADPKVHNDCSSCHDSQGGLVNEAAGKSFDDPGNCITCHIDPFDTLHETTPDHSSLVTTTGADNCSSCHANALIDVSTHLADCLNCHNSEGSLVTTYNTNLQTFLAGGNCATCHTSAWDATHTETNAPDHTNLVQVATTDCASCHSDPPPLTDAGDAKVHDACASCHNTNGSLQTTYNTNLQTFLAGGNCTTCHTGPFDSVHPEDVDHSLAIQISTDCDGCHTAPPPVIDLADSKVHDECATCHDANGGLIDLASGNTAPNECITCHGDDLNTLHPSSTASHEAAPGSADVLVFAAGQHDSAMTGDGSVYIACNTCHITSLGTIHGNECAACHSGDPSPYDSLGGFWAGGCQQGGCHTTYHADATASHWTVSNQCDQCHVNPSWEVPATNCANCHATDLAGDTEPPVTTSDVQAAYTVPALIKFWVTDNGGKVGIGTTYSRLDGEQPVIGSSLLVQTVGSHALEFWTVDQAGNEEQPHNFAYFTVATDSLPPVTTSNALSNYYSTAANIALTATDDNHAGIITTHYSLDGGPVQTGNSVHVAEPDGTISYSLEYWSVDSSGNEEFPHHTVNFTIHGGTGTLRLVWSDSDTSGSPCSVYPEAEANWTIRRGSSTGPLVASGSGACPNWSGIEDVVVDVSLTPYHVSIEWWDMEEGYFENTSYPAVDVYPHGDIERLSY